MTKTELRKRAIEVAKERRKEMTNEFYEQTNVSSKKERAIIHDSQTMTVEELAERYGMDEDDIRIILGYI